MSKMTTNNQFKNLIDLSKVFADWDLLQGKRCQLKDENQTCDLDPEAWILSYNQDSLGSCKSEPLKN